MNKNKITLLDCTLRDGGYYNNWDFSKEIVVEYLKNIAEAKIDFVEIGFRSAPKNDFMGPYLYSTDNFLNTLDFPKTIDLGVMINANEFILESNQETKVNILKYFDKSKNSKVKLVRIAINFDNFSSGENVSKILKELGYVVGFNLMQSQNKSNFDYMNAAKIIKSWQSVDTLYFADSLGCMSPKEIKKITTTLLKEWDKPLGIHAHDNKGLAFVNTISAIENGCTWCDSTILGMGRGAGNAKTENTLLEINSLGLHKGNFKHLDNTIRNFSKLKKILNWGPNQNYHFAANNNIHPTYIQTLENDSRYSNQQIQSILNMLSKEKASSFNKSYLRSLIYNRMENNNGKWDATGWLKNKEVILVGSGPSLEIYKEYIINFIKENNKTTIFLNINKIIPNNLGYATVVSHETRMLFDFEKLCQLKHFIITPFSNFNSKDKLKLDNNNILDFGLSIEEDTYKVFPKSCKINSSLAVAYALAVITQAGAKKIYLVGFDGYDSNDPRQNEMNELILKYEKLNRSIPLESLTPTNYPIKKGSIFSPYSKETTYLLVIPARYKSSRLPGKPLLNVNGKSLIKTVWEKCVEAVGFRNVLVATDDDKIYTHCIDHKINVQMTSSECLTGTDRVYEVSKKIKKDVYINVQGDEALVEVDDILKILSEGIKNSEVIINGMCEIKDISSFNSTNVPKVVTNQEGELLYMSRSGIPINKKGKFIKAKKQVCLYSFPRKAIIDFGQKKQKSELEKIEDIEILRFLEMGYKVKMVDLIGTEVAVDTSEDLKKVNKILKNKLIQK